MKQETDPTGTARKSAMGPPLEIDPEAVVSANPVVSCRIEGSEGAVLFNPDTDNTVLINPTGLAVWIFLASPHTIREITGHLITTHDHAGDYAAVLQDVVQFLSGLGSEFLTGVDTRAR